jgi:hypothetical protein
MFTYRRGLFAAQLIALVAVATATDEQTSQMKGIGMPILFMVTLVLAAILSRAQLLDAVTAARGDVNLGINMIVSLVTIVISIFLYFTHAYGYGLVSTILAYANIVGMGRSSQFAAYSGLVQFVWFCLLVGIPDAVSGGIINAISTSCSAFYPSYDNVMCKPGWLVFAQILACVQIGITMTSLLGAINQAAAAPSGGTYSPVRGSDGTDAPLRHNEYSAPQAYAPPASDYQKVTN